VYATQHIEVKLQTEISRKPLLSALIEGGQFTDHVEIREIRFGPGQQTGLHRHPCPVLGYVAKGTILFQVDGEPAKTLCEGDAFFEPANRKMLHFDNASRTEPAAFIALYLLGAGEDELIEMLR